MKQKKIESLTLHKTYHLSIYLPIFIIIIIIIIIIIYHNIYLKVDFQSWQGIYIKIIQFNLRPRFFLSVEFYHKLGIKSRKELGNLDFAISFQSLIVKLKILKKNCYFLRWKEFFKSLSFWFRTLKIFKYLILGKC